MFICAITHKLSKPNERAYHLVTHVRNKSYSRRNFKTEQDEVVGHGTEIVREVLVSKEAYDKLMANGFQPEVVKERQ